MKRYLFLSLLLAGCEPPPLEEGPADPPPAEEKVPMPHKNRLAKEKSPYLLQHAANPVDWYPWGEEAFEKAKKEDKPIFLSVGYSTCHWCHVMERESFENEEIAKILNEKYVSIKVDREERPDVDEIYMEAVQAMNNGSGGWPMSVFLTPDREPFFAGTYFPPDDRFGRPGFGSLLGRISELWKTQRAEVTKQGKMLVDYLAESGEAAAAKELSPKLVGSATRQLLSRYDSEYGGFGGAPKFPPSMVLGFLLRVATADGPASAATKHTFDSMARGGMYDQLGGGFARYSTDEMWLIPHFEKMLYDNAQLARAYAESFVVTGDAYHARIAREILDYVRREMTAPEGAFWSATDADSEGEEGKFFAWKPEEIAAVLGKDEGAAFCEYYGVTKDGNFEHGSSALHVETFDEGKDRRFADARAKLYEARKKRIPPHLDDKILTSWNGLMISAFATASWALDEPVYLEAARKAARFLVDNVIVNGRLRRGWRQGVMSVGGFLDDYAYLSAALLDLYEASGELEWYVKARDLSAKMVELFSDPARPGFFTTGNDQEKLIARRKDVYDGAVPSGNSVAAMTLLRVSKFTSDPALRQRAVDTLSVFHERMEKLAPAQAEMLKAVAFVQAPPKEVVISGKPGAANFAELARAARRAWPPNRVLAFATGKAEEEKEMPILVGRNPGDQAMAFVCVGETCLPPIRTVEELLRALK